MQTEISLHQDTERGWMFYNPALKQYQWSVEHPLSKMNFPISEYLRMDYGAYKDFIANQKEG